jgi:hypothetical protein
MTYREKRSAARTLVIIFVVLIFILAAVGGIILFINWLNPDIMSEVRTLLAPVPSNPTTIIQNQTINNITDQRTTFWDSFRLILWMGFALLVIVGVIAAIVMHGRNKMLKELSKAEIIRIHRDDIINSDDGHYRLGLSHSGDAFSGTLLLYHPYYDGTDIKTGKSFPRAVTFWSIDKVPPNTPVMQVSKDKWLWVDTPTENREKAIDKGSGPWPGQDHHDWQRWKYQQRHGLLGAPMSPIVDEQFMTPEEQKKLKEQFGEAWNKVFAEQGVN